MPLRPRRIFAAFVLSAALTGAGTAAGHAALGSAPPTASPTASPTTPNPSPYPPTVPADLTATAVHANSVTLSWGASQGGCCGVDHYVISYTQAFNDVFWSATVGNVTTATVTGNINAASKYRFTVSAVDSVNHQSAGSNAVTVVTPASDTAADTTPPTAPADLTLTGVSSAGVALTWSPATDDVGVAGYKVYRFDGWYTSVLVGSPAGTSFTAPVVGARDSFYVRARDAAGNVSIASTAVAGPPVTTTTPPPPSPVCRAAYRTTSAWGHGFVAEVTVTNTSSAALDGWTAAFTFGGDQRIASAWNGSFTQSGAGVTLTPATWNRTLAPGATATVGLIGSSPTGNAPPATLTCT